MNRSVVGFVIVAALAFSVFSQAFNGYEVIVVTGGQNGAGTDANVFLTIYGSSSNSSEINLNNQVSSDKRLGLWENNQWDWITLPVGTAPNCGDITRIKLRHDNSGNRPGWWVCAVNIKNLATQQNYTFIMDRWLATDENDHQTWVEVNRSPATRVTYKAPYAWNNPWKYETVGSSRARAYSNKTTGGISMASDAWVGGSTAVADQGVNIYTPSQSCVCVHAKITYVGGLINYSLASFSELMLDYTINGSENKTNISPAFTGPIVIDKLISLAALAAPGLLPAGSNWLQAIELLATVNDVNNLTQGMVQLINSGSATVNTKTFAFKSNAGTNRVSVGLRTNVTAVATGAAFAIIGGQVTSIDVIGVYPTGTAAVTTVAKNCNQSLEFPVNNRCWGFLNTHTYDLGAERAIKTIGGTTVAGPSEQKGVQFAWQIRLSSDNATWRSVGAITGVGATNSAFGPLTVNQSARYVQIFANSQGCIDASDISVTY